MRNPTTLPLLAFILGAAITYGQAPDPEHRQPRRQRTICNIFSGPVKAEWLNDGRHMKILERLTYSDPYCRQWEAPAGAIVDGASIPQLAWSLIGGPFEGKYRDASVIHDVACEERSAPWEYVHLVFYYAMLAKGVDRLQAKIMYAAVYHFGPRWDPLTQRNTDETRQTLRPQDFDKLVDAIKMREPSDSGSMTLTEIESFVPGR
jgi:hypothetical protein